MTSADPSQIPQKFEKHFEVVEPGGMTAIELLSSHTDLSRQKLKQIMQKGAVWLTQGRHTVRIRRATRKLQFGQIVHLYYDEKVLSQQPPEARLISDEGDYSVWFKPVGMLSQGSKYGDHTSIYRWAEVRLQPQRNAFLVHRLDRATQGLMLLAHSKKAAAVLSEMFKERQINKYYQAIVKGAPQPQTIDSALDDKQAITRIISSEATEQSGYNHLTLQILTGRKHQIRRHLAGIGYPVLGEPLYKHSGQVSEPDTAKKAVPELYLTASRISFISPFDGQEKDYQLEEKLYPGFSVPTARPDVYQKIN